MQRKAREKRNAIPGGCDALPSGTAGCLGKGGSTGGGNRNRLEKVVPTLQSAFFVGKAWVLKKTRLKVDTDVVGILESWDRGEDFWIFLG